ncbi:MAG: efflux RND transporter permease subunit [Eubacterium sp.]|nr:efflux RND transporter permease subunit [Eubacterium sp.]
MLSKFSVRKPFTVFVAVVICLVLGFLSFQNMSTDFLPSMELPYALVMTTYPGASPEEVEKAVSEPVEQAMARINNVKQLQSISVNNMSIVMMEFNDGTDMGSTTVDMRESLDMVTARFDDSIGSPTIMKMNPDMMPIMVAAIDYDKLESTEVTKKAEKEIIPDIESVEGVASVNESGAIEKKIQVIIQQDKIDEMNRLVQDAIDGKLSDAQDKIDSGKKKLEDGKDKLEAGKEKAADKIAKGETKLNSASEQIKEGLKTIEENITKVKEQQTSLKKTEKQVNDGLASIAANKTKLKSTIQTLTASQNQLTTTKNSLDQLKAQETSLKTQIENWGDKAPQELKTSLTSVQTQLQVVRDKMKQAGITEEMLPTKLAEVNTALTSANSGLTELEKQEKTLKQSKAKVTTAKKKIESGLKKLNATKKKLEKGKITTTEALEQLNKQKILSSIQLSVSEAQINSGTKELKDADKQLKDTKKTTKDNSDLNKIITKEMVENVLKAENFDMPSGYITEEDASYLVRVGDKIQSEDDIKNLVICDMDLDGLDPITLSDVADVAVTDNSEDVYTVVNGNPAVLVTMQKQSGCSTGDVTDALEERFDKLESENDGLHISVLMNQGVYIDLVVDAVVQNLLLGGLLAILILLFFLRDLRPTLIVACSIPLSVVAAIVAMYFSGVTLNIISLSGLALGVGMLVDNSVVVIENVFRLKQMGYSTKKAAIEGARQVAGAIVASTLTTICVFAPIIFTEGLTKQLFVDLALTLAYTLGASLLVALTLVPAMSAGLIRRTKNKESRIVGGMQRLYGKLIGVVLRFKPLVLIGAVVLLVLFAVLSFGRGFSMMPEMESTQMTVTLTMEDGTELAETKKISNQVVKKIREIPDVETVGAYTGSGSSMSMLTGSGGEDTVTMYVLLKEDREISNAEVTEQINQKTKNLNCEVDVNASAMDMSAMMGQGVNIIIKGKDLDKLQSLSESLMKELKKVDGLEEITNGLEDAGEEYRISIDKAKAMKYSLTVAQVYQQIQTKLKEASSSSTVSTDTDDLGVYVSSSADENLTRKDVQNMKIDYTDAMTQKTKKVRLDKIAEFKTADSPTTIYRNGQTRFLTVKAKIKDGYIVSDVSKEAEKIVNNFEKPAGYEFEMDGENEATTEAMGQALLMMALGILLMYLIMVAQFQSLLSPFIILFTIPLAFTGGFLGLWISGSDVSVIAMIGFVMLSGIIVNNGIVLVDYINQLRRGGMEKREAIREAGMTRLRPILMTALTTVLGLLPMVVGGSMGTDMTRPMAIVTIGGLIYGTLLTLFVVPCIYDLLNRKKDITEKNEDDE